MRQKPSEQEGLDSRGQNNVDKKGKFGGLTRIIRGKINQVADIFLGWDEKIEEKLNHYFPENPGRRKALKAGVVFGSVWILSALSKYYGDDIRRIISPEESSVESDFPFFEFDEPQNPKPTSDESYEIWAVDFSMMAKEIDRLEKQYERSIYEAFKRSGEHRNYIIQIFKKYNVPPALVDIAFVESRWQYGNITSSAKARGLYQFIRGTGLQYDLANDAESGIDDRRDPIRSAEAAARYLRDIYDNLVKTFKENNIAGIPENHIWLMALIVYNRGPKAKQTFIEKQGNLAAYVMKYISALPETAEYAPRFLAVRRVLKKLARQYQSNVTSQGMISRREFISSKKEPSVELNPIAQFDEISINYPKSEAYEIEVEAGETLTEVAQKEKIYVHDILRSNKGSELGTLENTETGDMRFKNNRTLTILVPERIIRLGEVSETLQIPLEELYALNPAFPAFEVNRSKDELYKETAANMFIPQGYRLRLPAGKASSFVQIFNQKGLLENTSIANISTFRIRKTYTPPPPVEAVPSPTPSEEVLKIPPPLSESLQSANQHFDQMNPKDLASLLSVYQIYSDIYQNAEAQSEKEVCIQKMSAIQEHTIQLVIEQITMIELQYVKKGRYIPDSEIDRMDNIINFGNTLADYSNIDFPIFTTRFAQFRKHNQNILALLKSKNKARKIPRTSARSRKDNRMKTAYSPKNKKKETRSKKRK